MQRANQQQPHQVGPMRRLNALAAEALAQYHAEVRSGGDPFYPAWVDEVAAIADELARAQAHHVAASQEH